MTPAALRHARRSLDLTQAQLAAALGRSLSIIGKWEGGKSPVPAFVPLALQGLGWVETDTNLTQSRESRSGEIAERLQKDTGIQMDKRSAMRKDQ